MEGPRDGDIEGAKVVAMVSQSASGNEPPIGHFQRALFRLLLETSGRATRESGIATEAPHSGPKQTMLTPHANRHPHPAIHLHLFCSSMSSTFPRIFAKPLTFRKCLMNSCAVSVSRLTPSEPVTYALRSCKILRVEV